MPEKHRIVFLALLVCFAVRVHNVLMHYVCWEKPVPSILIEPKQELARWIWVRIYCLLNTNKDVC